MDRGWTQLPNTSLHFTCFHDSFPEKLLPECVNDITAPGTSDSSVPLWLWRVYVEISWAVFSPVAPLPQPFPAAFLSYCSTGTIGDIKKLPGMYLKCVGAQRRELGYSWRGCDQEWGRQGAWLHRNNYLLLFLAGRMKYWSPLQ